MAIKYKFIIIYITFPNIIAQNICPEKVKNNIIIQTVRAQEIVVTKFLRGYRNARHKTDSVRKTSQLQTGRWAGPDLLSRPVPSLRGTLPTHPTWLPILGLVC